MNSTLITRYVAQLKMIQDGENWLDENFRKKIDGLSYEDALVRPHPLVHSVAELLSHLMEWRKECLLRMTEKRSSLSVDSPGNWRTPDELRLEGWPRLRENFYQSQHEIIAFLESRDDMFLRERFKDDYDFQFLVEGLIHHDLYHLGQIGITIKLLKN